LPQFDLKREQMRPRLQINGLGWASAYLGESEKGNQSQEMQGWRRADTSVCLVGSESKGMSDCTWVEKLPQALWPLLREAIAGFLYSCTGQSVDVRAVVIDLVACDQEICPGCSRVRPDAYPKVVGNFVIRDGDVCILVRDFDPASLTVGIVQVDLTIDDLVRVDQQDVLFSMSICPPGHRPLQVSNSAT